MAGSDAPVCIIKRRKFMCLERDQDRNRIRPLVIRRREEDPADCRRSLDRDCRHETGLPVTFLLPPLPLTRKRASQGR
jgi:hypothetical protein